jgi:hypothetical protein
MAKRFNRMGEQGISNAGNRRLRHVVIELGWLWLKMLVNPGLGKRYWGVRVGFANYSASY